MNKVLFQENKINLNDIVKLIPGDFYKKGVEVVIKIHFGEPGSKTAFTAEDIKPLVELFKKKGMIPVLVDTPVAYDSPRSTKEGYEKVIKEREFDKLCKCIVSDNYIKVMAKDFQVMVSKELVDAERVIVLSHVKGHPCAGFGGAIKNLGMGGVSRETKELEHHLCKPKFVKDCVGCGICVKLCPAKAIIMIETKPR
jgi:uncharacterized protein